MKKTVGYVGGPRKTPVRGKAPKLPTLISSSDKEVLAFLRACISPASFWPPEQIPPDSAWLEHAPFGFWLIGALHPQTFVELGTHRGFSYFAFCQAVQRLQLKTRCYAVDTWKGDEHAGFYGEEVFREVCNENDRRYSAFSNLIRSSFDDASRHFGDGSIDLLHIDGRHFFDDVKHDFETWRPKLSDRAVVLFHDTNVRERDFGVFRLWNELRQVYPHFQFLHGHGLGVLGIGKELPEQILALFAAHASGEASTYIERAYSRLGSTVTFQFRAEQLQLTIERQVAGINKALAERDAKATALDQALAERNKGLAALQQALSERDAQATALDQALAERNKELAALQQALTERDAQATALDQALAERNKELTERDTQATALKSTLSALYASTSWRSTAPLRFVKRLLGRFRYSAVGYPLTLGWQVLRTRSRAPLRDWRATRAIARSGLFDREWYTMANPDVAAFGIDPVCHYVAFGAREGRDPSPSFSTRNYLSRNPDVAAAGLNPLSHFIFHGASEGRVAHSSRKPCTPLQLMSGEGLLRAVPAPEAIALPIANSNPDVSVVILSYGQVDYTLRCLSSIAEHPSLSTVEIIVSDDCSGAPDLDKLRRVPNLTLLQTPQNLGFLKHANWAVAQTKGNYVLLLNNDIELKPGAIDALVETARTTPNVGLVGSKLLYPDGSLQEAGGIVWNDASAWNYGRLDDPNKPEYNYVRDVDYISGASILVPRAVWGQLGGFDEIFAPAYCEDTDLAFQLRQAGFRVIYQPASVVTHHEGVSHGADTSSGVKAFQVVNRARFQQKWLSVLEARHYRNGEHIMRARDGSNGRRTMLMIDHIVPEPDRDAGSRSMLELIKSLQLEDWIIKFWPDNLRYDPIYTTKLQQMGVETVYSPWVISFDEWLTRYCGEIDAVFLSRPTIALGYLDSLKRIVPKVPKIFYGHDLHSARMRMQFRVTNDSLLEKGANEIEAIERKVWRAVDVTLYPSREEADQVKQLDPSVDVRPLVPYCFDDLRSLRMPPASRSIIFVAGFAHAPNVDAAVWLVQEILPLVRRELPDAVLQIIGSNPTAVVQELATDFVEVTGYVTAERLEMFYSEARASVVPLRFGAGVKLKVVEAIHEGIPLVTTPVGVQGLEGLKSVVPVTDNAKAIAAAILQLLKDDARWIDQAQRQLDYAKKHFSRSASRAAISDAVRAAFAHAGKRNAEQSICVA